MDIQKNNSLWYSWDMMPEEKKHPSLSWLLFGVLLVLQEQIIVEHSGQEEKLSLHCAWTSLKNPPSKFIFFFLQQTSTNNSSQSENNSVTHFFGHKLKVFTFHSTDTKKQDVAKPEKIFALLNQKA